MQGISERFAESFAQTDDILTTILNEKTSIQLSLKQLSKLHHLQSLLEQFHFLNIVYSDSSRVRKTIKNQASYKLGLQKELCEKLDSQMKNFLIHFQKMDYLILYILNSQISPNSFDEFIKHIGCVSFFCEDFTIAYQLDNKLKVYSTDASIQLSKNQLGHNQKELQKFYEYIDESLQKKSKVLLDVEGNTLFQQYYQGKKILLLRSKTALFVLHERKDEVSSVYHKNFPENQLQIIADQLIAIIYDFEKEIYQKENLVCAIRGIKSYIIQNSLTICQQLLKNQIEETLQTKSEIIQKGTTEFQKMIDMKITDITFERNGSLLIPIKFQQKVSFYLKIEDVAIDVLTFSDYVSYLWQQLIHKLSDLQQQEFLNQMIEVNAPSKLFIAVDKDLNIVYQSGPVPQSWNFMEITQPSLHQLQNLTQIKMEAIYKGMIVEKINSLKSTTKGAIDGGQISFLDRTVDLDIFVRRDQNENIQQFYIAFDQPRKKFDESIIPSLNNIKVSDLAIEALVSLRNDKLDKACNLLRDFLKLSLDNDEIVDILRERELEYEVQQHENITEDIRSSYVIEYFRNDFPQDVSINHYFDSPTSPYKITNLIQDQQLTTLKKLDLFSIDMTEITNLSSWSFDICAVENQAEKIRYTWALFHLCNYMETYQINKEVFYQFLIVVQDMYNCRNNPFHNFNHGFTVAHSCFYFIKNKFLNAYLDQIEQFAGLFSALCHDVDHRGRTNAFEMANMSKLAIRYNDESVLENHHVSCLFKLLTKEKYNVLQSFSADQYKQVRKFAINNIMATDMKRHFDLVKQVEIKLAKYNDNNEPLIQKEDDKKLISGMIIHTCDFAHKAKPFEIDRKWSLNICEEFTAQIEEEKQRNLPITSYLQNLTTMSNISKNEISFIKMIVRPTYEIANILFGKQLAICLNNLNSNQSSWDQLFQQTEKELKQ